MRPIGDFPLLGSAEFLLLLWHFWLGDRKGTYLKRFSSESKRKWWW